MCFRTQLADESSTEHTTAGRASQPKERRKTKIASSNTKVEQESSSETPQAATPAARAQNSNLAAEAVRTSLHPSLPPPYPVFQPGATPEVPNPTRYLRSLKFSERRSERVCELERESISHGRWHGARQRQGRGNAKADHRQPCEEGRL